MNVAQWITEDNYEAICEGYKKLPPANNYDGTGRDEEPPLFACTNTFFLNYDKGYAFITNDGMLFNFTIDSGDLVFIVDTNGPSKGPNIYGRDIFLFYIWNSPSKWWGYPKEEDDSCFGDNKNGWNCGIRLLQEGKMNY